MKEKQAKKTPKWYDSPINSRIRDLLSDKEITNDEFAKHLCVTAEAVRLWNSGYSRPDLDKLVLIADFFQVSTDYLLGFSNYRQKENRAITVEELGLSERAATIIKEINKFELLREVATPHLSIYLRVLSCIIEGKEFEAILYHLQNYCAFASASMLQSDAPRYSQADEMKAETACLSVGKVAVSLSLAAATHLKLACDAFNSIAKEMPDAFQKSVLGTKQRG